MIADHTAIVLLGRGGVAKSTTGELAELAAQLEAQLAAQWPGTQVQPAFVDRWQPDLPAALDACASARTIVIVPLMLPDEAALRRWLHKVAMRWRAGRENCPTLIFAEPLSRAVPLPALLAAAVRQALTQPDVPAVVGGDDWQRDPQGWSSVPGHSHHALWCTGPRCAAAGAVALWPVLTGAINDTPDLKKCVRPLQTSCQYPCNHGPLMIVYPEGVWYGPLDAGGIRHVLTRHVLHGEVDAARHVHGPLRLPQKP